MHGGGAGGGLAVGKDDSKDPWEVGENYDLYLNQIQVMKVYSPCIYY